MKLITNKLARVILSLVAVGVMIGVLNFTAPTFTVALPSIVNSMDRTAQNVLTINFDGFGEATTPDPAPDLMVETGTEYEDEYYIYKYNNHYSSSGSWVEDSTQDGWGVRVKNTSLSAYPAPASVIGGEPITNVNFTYYTCSFLTTAPTIPDGVTDMYGTFTGCTALTEAAVIPDSVTDMSYTFAWCAALTSAPDIPDSVIKMEGTFQSCSALTTAPNIGSGVTDMFGTFSGCTSLTASPALPDNVTDMRTTFHNCTSLSGNVTIPASVINMVYCFSDNGKEITMKYYSTCSAAVNYEAPDNVTKVVIS